MIIDLKLVAGSVAVLGVSAPWYFLFRRQCSFQQTSYFFKASIDTSESILECSDQGKNYAVFLVNNPVTSAGRQDSNSFSFRVVDKKDNKVKWGPDATSNDKWTDWGVQIVKNTTGEQRKDEVKIRIKARGVSRNTLIPCGKSLLRLKKNGSNCAGNVFWASKTQFALSPDTKEISIKNDKFEWEDGFKPKQVFCTK